MVRARRIVLPVLVLSLAALASVGGGASNAPGSNAPGSNAPGASTARGSRATGPTAPAVPPVGSISGRVTSSTTALGLAGSVQFRNVNGSLLNGNLIAGTAPLDGTGNYSINLPPGDYLVVTQNTQGYVNQISSNIPCSSVCDVASATPITVTTTPITGIDFVLDPGGLISGTVTDQNTGLPIANATIRIYDSTGSTPFTKAVTDASGNYTSEGGTVTGKARARTENSLGYFNKRWNDAPCTEGSGCPMQSASQFDVVNLANTGGVNFALSKGGQITGTVIDGNGAPLANVKLFVFRTFEIHLFSDLLAIAETDALGHYATSGLPTGSLKVYTKNGLGFVDQLYNGVTCLYNPFNPFFCDPAIGTPVAVTLGATTQSINFALQQGGQITGALTNAQNGSPVAGSVSVFTVGGAFLTFATGTTGGQYQTPVLPPGTYFVSGGASGFGTQVYNGVPCGGCDPTLGTPVIVTAGATTNNIHFPLVAPGSISGLVTATPGGSGVQFVTVEAFGPNGQALGSGQTNAAGNYSIPGLTGSVSYVVRSTTGVFYPGTTAPNAATPVAVTPGAPTTNVNFSLQSAITGAISGTVTNVSGGAALFAGIKVFNASGILVGQTGTDVNGFYTVPGLPDGTYYVRTDSTPPKVNEIYNDLPCESGSCVVLAGTPVTVAGGGTTSNINFALTVSQGGRILGDVKTADGHVIPGIPVQMFSATGRLLRTATSSDIGTYVFSDVPGGLYFLKALGSAAGLMDELFGDLPCFPGDSVLVGHPVIVNTGDETASFALDAGGTVIGTVRDANTLAPLASTVALYSAAGALAKTATANANGFYAVVGLPQGTYYARTQNTLGYKDKIFNNIPFCDPGCQVTDGSAVVVTIGNITSGVDFDLVTGTEMMQNSGFTNGLANWSRFALPDLSYLVGYLFEGAFNYFLTPPAPGGSSSAVILQNTNVAVGTGDPILVQFDLANTSDERKRISVLVHDASFTDLAVCTFWLGPNAPARRYGLLTHPTQAWTSASVSLYAASVASQGGYYRLDNVTMQTVSNVDIDQTQCIDPFLLAPGSGTTGPELLVNGSFSTGNTQGWTLFGQITSQVSGGVFEFFRPSANPDPAGVILQPTGTAIAAGDRLTAHFELGNSSSVRKRVSVLLHDFHWADLTVCTFWLEPGQPLSPYTMQGYANRLWNNATISFYAATAGNETWMRLDNVSLKNTPSAAITGTNCFEPGSVQPPAANGGGQPATAAGTSPAPALSSGATVDERAIELEAAAGRVETVATLLYLAGLDLTGAAAGTLSFEARLGGGEPGARVEISVDGEVWQTLAVVPPTDAWLRLTIDLSPYAGRLIRVRFVFVQGAAGAADAKRWQIRNVTLIPSDPH